MSCEMSTGDLTKALLTLQIPEMFCHVMSFLEVRDQLALLSSCKTLYDLFSTEFIRQLRIDILLQHHREMSNYLSAQQQLLLNTRMIILRLFGRSHAYTKLWDRLHSLFVLSIPSCFEAEARKKLRGHDLRYYHQRPRHDKEDPLSSAMSEHCAKQWCVTKRRYRKKIDGELFFCFQELSLVRLPEILSKILGLMNNDCGSTKVARSTTQLIGKWISTWHSKSDPKEQNFVG